MPEGTKKRATKPRAVKEPEVKAEVQKCKSCGSELKKMLFDSRAEKPVYVWVCDKRDCPLYRRPQGLIGTPPIEIKVI